MTNAGDGKEGGGDRWRAVDTVDTDNGEMEVSTAELPFPHGAGRNQTHETLVTGESWDTIVERYESRSDAEQGHVSVCQRLRHGNYQLVPVGYRLELGSDDLRTDGGRDRRGDDE